MSRARLGGHAKRGKDRKLVVLPLSLAHLSLTELRDYSRQSIEKMRIFFIVIIENLKGRKTTTITTVTTRKRRRRRKRKLRTWITAKDKILKRFNGIYRNR